MLNVRWALYSASANRASLATKRLPQPEFFAAIYNVPRQKRQKRIMEVLKLVGLENSAFDLYQKYSGGMKSTFHLQEHFC
jgi:ABC-type Na+ transport system ATPase subunit NatA